MGKNIFARFDALLDMEKAIKYAESHCDELIAGKENATKLVFTTLAYELGVACPSLVAHRVIGGNKRGRVMKERPKTGKAYCEIGFDEREHPLYFKYVNSLGTENTEYFFEYDGFHWAMELIDDKGSDHYGRHLYGNIYRFRYDDRGRIQFYAVVMSKSAVICEEYEYPDPCSSEDESILCHHYYYVPTRVGTEKDVPAGFEHSPMTEYLYKISKDQKEIREFRKTGDEYILERELVAGNRKKNNPKPASDSFDQFSNWMNALLEDDEIPKNGGVYLQLFAPAEDGFGVFFEVCREFDRKDSEWACDAVYSSKVFMISTNGEMDEQKALKAVVAMVRRFLREGSNRALLKQYEGIGVGYADGDLVYP